MPQAMRQRKRDRGQNLKTTKGRGTSLPIKQITESLTIKTFITMIDTGQVMNPQEREEKIRERKRTYPKIDADAEVRMLKKNIRQQRNMMYQGYELWVEETAHQNIIVLKRKLNKRIRQILS